MNLNNYLISFVFLTITILVVLVSNATLDLRVAYATVGPLTEKDYSTYYNPYEMIKIQYPSYWNVSENIEKELIVFESPLDSIGVIIQNKPTPGISIDEFTMEMISMIRSLFPNVHILDTQLTPQGNKSSIQTLIFTYETDSIVSKILLKIRSYDDSTFMFVYYSDPELFDRFYPISNHMYRSVQTPVFENIFGIEGNLNASIENLNQGQMLQQVRNNGTNDKNNNSKNITNDNYVQYNNRSLDLEFEYPADLELVDLPQGVLITSQNNTFGGSIAKVPLRNLTMDEFIPDHILHLNESLDDLTILNSSTSDIIGYPTQMIMFNYTKDFNSFQGVQFWKQSNESVYIVTFYAGSEYFDRYLPQIGRILSSLDLMNRIEQ